MSKESCNDDLEFDSIISAKNEWESCVDSLEHQVFIILDHNLNIIKVNRTIESWGWGDVNNVSGTHLLNLIKSGIKDNSLNEWYEEWYQLDIQEYTEWESTNEHTGKKHRFSFYPNKDINSFHRNDKCYAVMLITDVTEKKPLSSVNRIHERTKPDSQERDKKNNLFLESENRLHQLTCQLINSQKLERKRVSCELHDGIGQILSALKFQVESVVLESKNTPQKRKNDIVLNDVLDNIKIALRDLKRISVELGSSVIDDLGLLMALRWFTEEHKKIYTDINIEIQLDVYESKICDDNKNIIYRIVQEAMNNIAKHADAKNIHLQLIASHNGLLLRITDDGCGFDVDKTKSDSQTGLGLRSMEERAVSSGAKFTMSSNTLSGTAIQIFWNDY